MKSKQFAVLMAATFLMAGAAPAMAADVFVYPKQNQSKDQQEQDTFSCYKWAKEQTGFDPTKPVAQASTPPPQGGAASGAAKGAAVGAIGGAIAGDPGKGAAIGAGVGAAGGAHRRRQAEKQQEAAQQQAEKRYEASVDGYQRAFEVCMDAKGYAVK
ncbi:MAG: glycine zipper domain-containing protein [Nitrospira sp.]|nr:glycine zipper domain-containing protein [Nitrospira sp.]